MSVSAATRAGAHLAADALAQHYTARTRAWLKRLGAGLGLLPWALFVLIASYAFVVPSLIELEAFPETDNPGYFFIKSALWLMALTVTAQSVVDIFRPLPRDDA